MSETSQETRQEEVARVRSYLASQAMKRTPAQLVDALREAHRQFLEATAAISDANFHKVPEEGEWAAADVLAHVRLVASLEEKAIRAIIEQGEQPAPIKDEVGAAPAGATREAMLAELALSREQLYAVVLQADPDVHLDILWGHGEFGRMNWREWLLFARVHALDHARQVQTIATALAQQ